MPLSPQFSRALAIDVTTSLAVGSATGVQLDTDSLYSDSGSLVRRVIHGTFHKRDKVTSVADYYRCFGPKEISNLSLDAEARGRPPTN